MMYESLPRILMMLAMQAPIFLVLGIGLLVVLTNMPPGGGLRGLTSAGLGILFGSHLLRGVVMTLLPTLIFEHHISTAMYTTIISSVGLIFSLLEALGYGLLLMALMRAARQLHAARQ